ncbi:MAG: exonuclease domain-containing protein [Kangiellaceae bacterium]|jgi:DNA polymerase III epsilon subunit-like protein|nr:exonuclease domain-containing protein [Kangiellaceae bacterium]
MTKIFLSKELGHVNAPSITIFDFETTSKEPAIAEIITGYFRTVDAQTKALIDEMKVKMRPLKWNMKAQEIHGITEEEARTYPEKRVMMREIFRYLTKHKDSVFICHANYTTFGIRGYFDWQVLKTECLYLDVLHHFKELFNDITIYSTHTMAKDRKLPLRRFGLGDIAEYYGIEFKHHDCKEDVIATEKIFWELVETRDLLTIMEE